MSYGKGPFTPDLNIILGYFRIHFNTILTKDIPLAEVQKLFPEYQSLQIFLEPGDLGHTGMRRRRTFIFLRHMECCEYVVDVYDLLEAIKKAQKKIGIHEIDYFLFLLIECWGMK